MYDETAKKATMKYMAENREKLSLNLAKGKKGHYKKYAQTRGMSLTELIETLLAEDMKKNGYPLPSDKTNVD